MTDYLSFADGIPLSDPIPADSDEEFYMSGVNLDEVEEPEVPEVQFNDPTVEAEDLVTAPTSNPELSRKRPREDDDSQNAEELIEGSGIFVKRPRIPGCPDMKEWLLKNKRPVSLQDPDIRDHCAESLRFPSDVQKWAEYVKDDLPSALIGHFLEVRFLTPLLFPLFKFWVADSLFVFADDAWLTPLEG